MKVQDVMTRQPRRVAPDAPVREAARIMRDDDVGIVPVVEGERLVGLVTDRDIAIRVVAEGRDGNVKVRDVMSADRLATARPDQDIEEVMGTMAREQVRRIPVVDERGALVGIVAQADVVRKVPDDKKAEKTVERISEPREQHAR